VVTRSADADRQLVAGIRTAYARSADGWAAGPAAVYRRLALGLVATAGEPLTGRQVLDLGAGTGVASDVLTELGAHPVAVDLAVEMLAHRRTDRPPGVAGDAQALPFRTGAFDAVVAAFCLNHVPDLAVGLAECRRVTRTGGLLLASSFQTGADHPAKAVVEAVLETYGYQRPAWYATFKASIAEPTGDADTFARAATTVGLPDVHVEHLEVEAGLDDPRLAVGWRLNMPHTLAFVAALDRRTRVELQEDALAALPPDLPPTVRILALRARVP
jgi:SAM-dependent methyltransferase